MFPAIFPGAYSSCAPGIKEELARQERGGISVEGTTHRGRRHTEARGSRNRQSLLSSALLGRSHSHLEWSFANIKVHKDHLGDRVKMQILTQWVWGEPRDSAFVTNS